MNGFFGLEARNTTVSKEVKAGLTAAAAMLYIMMVNPGIISTVRDVTGAGATYGALYIATGLSAIVGTVAIGLLANMPFAQAPGMGLNAFFTYNVCLGLGFTYENALVCVLVEGVIFMILTATGARRAILEAIPAESVRKAISLGIGGFILLLGLQDSGIVIPSTATGVDLASFNLLNGGRTLVDIIPLILTFVGSVAIVAMLLRGTGKEDAAVADAAGSDGYGRKPKKPISGAILWGILGTTVVYYVVMMILAPEMVKATFAAATADPMQAFREFSEFSFLAVFRRGFDFSAYVAAHGTLNTMISLATTMLAFMMVDMFDTLGTLQGTVSTVGIKLDKRQMNRAMMADAIATTVGACMGTSTVTTFVESASAFIAGGQTGLSSLVTAGVFFVALFLSPVAALIPACAYSTALIVVGLIMIKSNIGKIEWSNWEIALPAGLTFVMMPFTYNISYGIAAGLFSYVIIKTCRGKAREVNGVTWVISGLFLLMLLVTH